MLRRAWAAERFRQLAQDTLNLHEVLTEEPGEHAETILVWLAQTADRFAEASQVVASKREGEFLP